MSDEKSPQGWWSTLPGLLTASATAITAIGGLIAILGQQGLLHRSAPTAPAVVASAPADVAAPAAASTPVVAAAAKDVSITPAVHTQTAQSDTAPAAVSAVPASVAPRGEIGSNMDYFAGSWQNINPAPGVILKIQIRIADQAMYVRVWEKCRPTTCDWGEVQAQAIGSNVGSQPGSGLREVTAQFKNNVRQIALTIHPAQNNHLRVEAVSNFVDQSGRAPLAKMLVFERM
jgi:hypothetical protein